MKKIRQKATGDSVEFLEPRAYLTGVILGTPQNLAAAPNGLSPVFVNLDDVNGDSKADLITANQANGLIANSVSVLLGTGTGAFGAPQTIAVPNAPLPIAEAILRPGGHLDIVAGETGGILSVIPNNGDGTFGAAQSYNTGLPDNHAIAIGDFNGDGFMDIAAVTDSSFANIPNLAIMLNNGSGAFALRHTYSVPHAMLSAITAFTAGGHTDLAVTSQADNTVTTEIGVGNGTFGQGANLGVGAGPSSIATADFNHDGKSDLVTSNSAGGTVSVLLGNGNGTFGSAVSSTVAGSAPGGGPLKVRVTNFNGDANPDLLVLLSSGSSGDASVLLGNGDGTFHTGTLIATGGNARDALAAGDLNADGLTDAVVADTTQVTSLLNITTQDTSAPTAAVDLTQPAPTLGTAVVRFTVTYSDSQQVDAATLGNNNLVVTGPDGVGRAASLVSTNLNNGPVVQATYQVAVASGALQPSDNGTYSVTANPNSVMNANGVALAGGPIGSFQLVAPIPADGPNLTVSALAGKLPSPILAGRSRTTLKVTVTNTGNQIASGLVTVTLYASASSTQVQGNAIVLGTITKKVKLATSGKRASATLSVRTVFPAGLNGTYFIVGRVAGGTGISETNIYDDIRASGRAFAMSPPFVEVQNKWAGTAPAALTPGKSVTLVLPLKNNGNVVTRGRATINIVAAANGVSTPLKTFSIGLGLKPGVTKSFKLRFKVPAIAAGNYFLVMDAESPGDTVSSNNSVTSTTTFTVA